MNSRSYLRRDLESVLKRASREFPVVILTGPRQSGKTTLLQHLFVPPYRYVSLEAPDVRAAATDDPRSFLERHPPPIIFDEVQNVPELLSYIKERVDEHRSEKGQYLLTGSQNLLLLARVTQTLAGRAAILRLFPMSQGEAMGSIGRALPWESGRRGKQNPGAAYHELWRRFLRGSYPELVNDPAREIQLWHSSYVMTYLERDVREIRQVGDLTLFQEFLQALAARSGQLLKLTELGRDLGVAANTAKAWLSVLEATHQVTILRPYWVNVGKRLVKSPKIYFNDTGTLCYLLKLTDPDPAAAGSMAGAIMETAVLAEIQKTLIHRGEVPRVYFFRTAGGVEVDFVIESEMKLVPVEVKVSATPKPSMAAGIMAFQEFYGTRAAKGYVVHPGDITLPLGPKATAVPFAEL